jgi:hypothetical protein
MSVFFALSAFHAMNFPTADNAAVTGRENSREH